MKITKKEAVTFIPTEFGTLSTAIEILFNVYLYAGEGGHLEKMTKICVDYLDEILYSSVEIENA